MGTAHEVSWARDTRRRTYVVQNDKRLGPASVVIANREENTLADDGRQDLLNEKGQEDGRDRGEDEVVDNGELLKLESVLVAHNFATSQNEDIVDDNKNSRLLQGGHGRDARLKAELAGRVAGKNLEDLVEDGP